MNYCPSTDGRQSYELAIAMLRWRLRIVQAIAWRVRGA